MRNLPLPALRVLSRQTDANIYVPLLCTALFSLGSCLSPAQTVFLDFNTPGQYTGNFTPWNDTGGVDGGNYGFMESSSSGVAGSGGVSVFQSTDTTASYRAESWDFSTNGAVLTLSVMVKANGQTSGNKVQLGFSNANNNGLNNNSGIAFESFRTIPSSSTVWTLHEQYRTADANVVDTQLGSFNVIVGHWYKFVVTATNTGSGNFDAGSGLFDFGADGLSPGTNAITFSSLVSRTGQDLANTAAVWPALRAFQNGGIDAWDNFVIYTPRSPPTITISLTNTTLPAGRAASFAVFADGPGPISYSWYTNSILAAGMSGPGYTTPILNTSYTNISVVAANSNGSDNKLARISVFVPSVAGISNAPPSNVLSTSATLGGRILSTGNDTPVVTLFYGTANGGTNVAAWSNSITIGLQSGLFSQSISNLAPDTGYYFTANAANAAGTNWATPSLSFTTPPLSIATLVNLPATNIQATSATLNGNVTFTGGDTPMITLYYGSLDAGTNVGLWPSNFDLGIQNGFFAQTITGLLPNSTYYFAARGVNAAGAAWARPSQSFTTPASNSLSPCVAVLTQHNDNSRTGANLAEVILNVANVNTNRFGLLFSRTVDDQIYAQPLVMTNVNILGRGTHNVVLVCTVKDTIYAFDADNPSFTTPYWIDSFINPPSIVPPSNADMSAIGACGGGYRDFSGYMGIVGTPVIDPAAGTLFVVVRTKENGSSFIQRLHALDVANGSERPGSPVLISAICAGNGDGNVNGTITFDLQRQNQRPALALANGVVYIAWSSHCDNGPYHGWVMAYSATNLQQVAVWNNTPNGSDGGIWMSGQGPSADSNGNIFVTTGNGSVDANDYGESFVKLALPSSGTNMTVASYFTPFDWSSLNGADQDLGTAGLLLPPGTSLAISGGKSGTLYVVDRDNMGGLSGGNANIIQSWTPRSGSEIHGGPVWWNGPNGSFMYLWPDSGDRLRQYQFSGSQFDTTPYAQGPTIGGGGSPGGILAVSANGTNAGTGIIWAIVNATSDANQAVVSGTLHAYNAQNVTNELWNSAQVSRDVVGNLAKFVPPTVANGKVYVATFSNRLNVYGQLPLPQLNISQNGSGITLVWPATSTGFGLQSSTNLASVNWQAVNSTVLVTNGQNQVTLQATGAATFYRLKQ